LAGVPNYNYYRDDRLIAAGGDPAGTLDYYNVHFYGTQQQSPFNNPYSYWNLTKPLIAGEFYNQDTYGVPWQNLYETLYNTGYAGGFTWAWTDNYNNVQRIHAEQDMSELFSSHRNDIIVNPQTGTIYKFYAGTTTMQTGDTTTLYWDVEPGSTITLNNSTVSALDSLKIHPTTTTTYILSATGKVTSSSSITITVLPTGRIISFKALPAQIGTGESTSLYWNVVKGSSVTINGKSVAVADSEIVFPDSLHNSYILIAQGSERDSSKITVSILAPDVVNRALNEPVTVSSNDTISNPYSKPQFIDDGNNYTVWQATNSDGQWVQIDLGKSILLSKIIINWGSQAFATQYKVQCSNDLVAWQNIATTLSGTGGTNNVETISNIEIAGRYIIFMLQKRYSGAFIIKDIQVYGVPATTGIGVVRSDGSKTFYLSQNYPNPFNPSTIITYSVGNTGSVYGDTGSKVVLKVYDIIGREVATLVNEVQSAGIHSVEFNCNNLHSGVYFYTLHAGNFIQTKKMILVR
jgi:hypothetical protein